MSRWSLQAGALKQFWVRVLADCEFSDIDRFLRFCGIFFSSSKSSSCDRSMISPDVEALNLLRETWIRSSTLTSAAMVVVRPGRSTSFYQSWLETYILIKKKKVKHHHRSCSPSADSLVEHFSFPCELSRFEYSKLQRIIQSSSLRTLPRQHTSPRPDIWNELFHGSKTSKQHTQHDVGRNK